MLPLRTQGNRHDVAKQLLSFTVTSVSFLRSVFEVLIHEFNHTTRTKFGMIGLVSYELYSYVKQSCTMHGSLPSLQSQEQNSTQSSIIIKKVEFLRTLHRRILQGTENQVS